MNPKDKSLAALNRTGVEGHRMLCSDYEPVAGIVDWVRDLGMDIIHNQANDLVVPTDSVFGPKGPDDKVDPGHFMRFDRDQGVTHGAFLRRDDVQNQIAEWLRN